MGAEKKDHIPVKHLGLVNFARVTVGTPSKDEAERTAKALAPLRRRTGSTWNLEGVVETQYPSLTARIKRRLGQVKPR